jgi:hypothetical protein
MHFLRVIPVTVNELLTLSGTAKKNINNGGLNVYIHRYILKCASH